MFSQIKRFASMGGFKLLVGGVLFTASSVSAQSAAGGASSAASSGSAPAASSPSAIPSISTTFTPNGGTGTFLLDVDDVIAVQVANHPEMSDTGLPVSTSGKVALPIVGPISVRGKTLAEAQQLITKAYSRELKNPKVTVTLFRARPRQVMILGAVRTTGPLDMLQGWRVSEAIAAAGNLTEDPQYVQASLVRGKNAPMPLKLKDILSSPASSANVKLAPNDVLNFVAVPPMRVTVTGEVTTPGIVPLRGIPRVLDAVLAAGGPKYRPEQMRLTLMRDGKTTSLNLPAIVQGTSEDENIFLKEGDLLSFEGIQMNISVISLDNLVKTTGNYPLIGNATVLRALQEAGGLSVPPEKVVTTIRRGDRTIPVDLIKAVTDPASDLPLENNDVVLVNWPDGPRVRLMGSVTTAGPYSFKAGTTVLDAIVQAGGINGKPSEVAINVLRTMPDGRQINLDVDAVKLFELRDLGQNVRLQDNDLIFVNPATRTRTIFVAGDITTPGVYEIQEGEGLGELLLRAGGPLPTAALSRVSLTRRDGLVQSMDLSALLDGEKPQIDVALQQGDVINVPRNPNQVMVMNAVQRPGYVAVPERKKLTLANALLAVGGPVNNAKTKQIAIVRRLPNGETEKRIVSLQDVQKGNVAVLDIELEAGDIVYVPETVVKQSALSQLGQIMGTVGIFRAF
jgi:protein involved in polysaccharide export with SLBB domain